MATQSKRRILVLNVGLSGINRFLFSELERRGWHMELVEIPYPRLIKRWAQLVSFRPNLIRWKILYAQKLAHMVKSPRTFKWRTRFCEDVVKRQAGKYDLIFQISGMFAPALALDNLEVPYVTFNDYTMALARKYPDWASRPSDINQWLSLEEELYRHSCFVFATSENTRQSLIKDYGVAPARVVSIGYGVTFDELPDRVANDYSSKTILFVGIDFKRKGGHMLLKAFAKVREVVPEARLVIAGPNQDYYPVNQAGVEMLGNLTDRERVKKLYEEASVFVMPSLCEPFGLVFLEAMGYRLPCVGTDVDAMNEIIVDQETGYLVPVGDEQALAEKMIKLINDPDRCRRMGQAGYARLRSRYSWVKVGQLMHDCLKQCVNSQRHRDTG